MNNIKYTLLVFFMSSFLGYAQEIQVLDKTTQQAIPGVKFSAVFPKINVLSDQNGKIDVRIFEKADSVSVQFWTYKTQIIAFKDLKSMSKIELEADLVSISEVIVTANRWEEDKLHVPNRINKLDFKSVELQNPQTAADLLESSGYAFVQKSQLAGGSPQLRGFGTNKVMIVVDGVRMNNAIFRAGNLQNVISLDANSLEGTEILFGPGAVMYGSDAIGGVMDFKTLSAQFSKKPGENYVKGHVMGRYSTANQERTKGFHFNYGLQKWAFLTSATFSQYGDLRAGSNGNSHFLRPSYQKTISGKDSTFVNDDPSLQLNSGFSQYNVIQKIRFAPSKNWNIDYAFNYSETSNAARYDRLIIDNNKDGNLDYAEWFYGPQRWMMNSLNIVNRSKNKLYDQMRLTLALQNYEESRHDRKFNNAKLRNQTEGVRAYSANLDFDKKISDKLTVFYGGEAIVNQVSSKANRVNVFTLQEEDVNTRYPTGSTWQAYGIYANARYALSTKWNLNAGVRYSHFFMQADFDTSAFVLPFTTAKNSNGALNGSLGLVFNPNERTQVYANVSTGFRAPNIDDIGKVFESEPGSVVVPNVNLKPEYAYNAELGFVKSFKNRLKLDGAAYYTYLNNALARRNFQFNGNDSIVYDGVLSQVQAIQNITNAYVYGVQGGFTLAILKGLSLKSTINWQIGKEQSEDSLILYPKSHVAPLFGRTTLSYERRKFRTDFYVVYNGQMNAEDLPLNDRNDPIFAQDQNGNSFTPSWMTLNLKFAYYASKNVVFTAGVENITDQLYRSFGSGISSPGRNFIFSVKGIF